MALQSTSSRLYGILILCGVAWIGLQTYIIHSFGFIWYIAFTDGLVSSILMAAACWLINNNLRYYQPGKGSYVNILIWCGALATICTLGCRWLLPLLTTGPAYTNFLIQSVYIRAFIYFLAIGWRIVGIEAGLGPPIPFMAVVLSPALLIETTMAP